MTEPQKAAYEAARRALEQLAAERNYPGGDLDLVMPDVAATATVAALRTAGLLVTPSEGAVVYVLDWCGYDVRGGNAEVYATLPGAQETQADPWREESDGVWTTGVDHGTPGTPYIFRQVVKP